MRDGDRAVPSAVSYDAIVVGGGPAGLTAALYLGRARYRVLVLERETFGGQIALTHEVVNYPGVGKTSGTALTETMRRQAEAFGAELLQAEGTGLDPTGTVKVVHTDRGDFTALAVLLATGARPRPAGFTGEAEWRGRGVAYCATCDGEFFTGKDVFVIGGGYAAAEESVFLTRFARHVTVLIREEDFTCAAAVAEPARSHPQVTVRTNVTVEAVDGEAGRGLTVLRYRHTVSGEVTEFRAAAGETFGVFVFAGYEPVTDLAAGIADRTAQGYLVTDGVGQTSAEGIFAAGDVCEKALRQVVTATGDGALAATGMERYLARVQRETGLRAASAATSAAVGRVDAAEAPVVEASLDGRFSPAEETQLRELFGRMERPLQLRLRLDGRSISGELESLMRDLAALSDRLSVVVGDRSASSEDAPCVRIFREEKGGDLTDTGLSFHGVPGGHEFSSFVLGLFNAAGPGQPLDESLRREIEALPSADLTVLVTLSCSFCPELVTAVQRIASLNPRVTAAVYDAAHFPALRGRYAVQSVPCLILDGRPPSFGKKSLPQLLEWLKEEAKDAGETHVGTLSFARRR